MPSRVGIAINFIILLFFICKGTHNSPFFRIFAAIFNKLMKLEALYMKTKFANLQKDPHTQLNIGILL